MAACAPVERQPDETGEVYVGRTECKIKDGQFTPELLQEMGTVSDVHVSPDGNRMIWGVTYRSVKENKSNREIMLSTRNEDGTWGAAVPLTHTPGSEQNAVWLDNHTIAFLYKGQIWAMDDQGKRRHQLSKTDRDIEGFSFSPDGKRVLMIMAIPLANPGDHSQSTVSQPGGTDWKDLYEGLDKTTGVVYEDLMYRHWDDWVRNYPHPYLADVKSDGSIDDNIADLLNGKPWESPMRPFGGVESFAWSPDGRALVYTCRAKTGRDYAFSTNSDLYLYDTRTGDHLNLTLGNMGYDQNPVWSPDGKYLAWTSMERDGYESDKNRLMTAAISLDKGKYSHTTPVDLTRDYDNNCDGMIWSADGKEIIFLSTVKATERIMAVDVETATVRQLSACVQANYKSLTWAGRELIACRQSMEVPTEVFSLGWYKNGITGMEAVQISHENDEFIAALKPIRVEERWMTCTNGDSMLVWIIYPTGFEETLQKEPGHKFPTLLYCEGGPQSPLSQFWSLRWNFRIMASNGYVIVAPNRHGLPGFGQAWNEQISGDYSGQCIDDYLTAIDEVSKESWCDTAHLGAVGASFGGYSVYQLMGVHQNRFKCMIAHAGIYNWESMWGMTEELWFDNWDMGGAPYDTDNAVARRSYSNSPNKLVNNWNTPILVIHNEKDYRVTVDQGMQAFNVARMKGIPAQFLYFPDENHWVLQPQNGVFWQRVFFSWLDKWLKADQETKK